MLSLLCLLTLAGPALAQDDESELYMADMGVTAVLPDGWTVPRWSDWDLDAVDRAKTVQVHVEYTHLQVSPSPEAAKVWVGMAADRLRDQGHERVEMASTEVVEIDGRPTAEFELTYRYKGDQDAVYYQRSFNVDSRTVHLSATAVRRNARRAEEALATWDDTLQIEKPPQDLSALPQEVASEAGFASLLPPGWRAPLNGELGVVRQVAADAGQGSLDKEKCWWGMHPYPDGEAAVLLACSYSLYTGVVDEHSWTGMEQQMRDHFFKGVEVPAAERVATGADQRFSFLYTLPDVGDRAVRMAATPYDRGHVLTYAIGKTGDTGTLDGAIRAVLVSTTFDDPEGGKHPIGALQWMEYYWTYRKTSPVVWGPILLLVGFFGFIIMKARSKPSYDDL
ncbi:MAG: hypothetical protein H6739_11895 [Alphaproteobacteria bacterium]|nr:hypothetical protein [Alphaproteobacteria bacterium]